MRVALCCIIKNEYLYINDFCKWYIKLGVDTIYIFDNDNVDSPNILDFIDYNLHKHIKVFDIKGLVELHMQQHIYNDFYSKYKNNFDWCLFVDIDEYLFNVTNIKFLLSLPIYRNFNQIRIMWRLFGDDDLITRNMHKPVYEVFKRPITKSLMRDLKTKGNLERQGKFILRGGLNNVVISSPHFACYGGNRYSLVESCLPSGEKCYSQVVIKEDYSKEGIYLHHYMTKSLSEFIVQKMGRNDAVFAKDISIEYYLRVNTLNEEKKKYLDELGIKYE